MRKIAALKKGKEQPCLNLSCCERHARSKLPPMVFLFLSASPWASRKGGHLEALDSLGGCLVIRDVRFGTIGQRTNWRGYLNMSCMYREVT